MAVFKFGWTDFLEIDQATFNAGLDQLEPGLPPRIRQRLQIDLWR